MTTTLPATGSETGPRAEVIPPGAEHESAGGGLARRVPMRLTRRQKAAIIVRLLLAEGAQLPLQTLPESLQAELARQLANMRFIDRVTLKAVVDEFVAEIENIGLSFPGGLDGALSLLDGRISAGTVARIRKARGMTFAHDPWETILRHDAEALLPLVEAESDEVAAVVLSKIKVSTAAEIMSRLPGPRARRIAYAVSLTANITPEVIERIGRALAAELESRPPPAFDKSAGERVGAILNQSPAETREEVLEGLSSEDAGFAEAVRRAIFTFANIPERLDPRDIPKVTRTVDQAMLITALAAATGPLEPVREFFLGAMSKRMAEQLREEIADQSTVRKADGEAAMNAIVATIRNLETAGEIALTQPEEED